MNATSINDRINPYGKQPNNPVLRWTIGNAAETIRLESSLYDADSDMDGELDYSDPWAIWGDGDLDEPISDGDWARLLECVGIR